MTVTNDIRLDRGNLLRFERTPEGYLRGEAVVSRTGVFPYRNDDGSLRYELRHPDDILTQDTLDSIRGIPVTMDHPSELVNADNAKSLTIGYVGDNVRIDGPNIIANFTVTDAEAIRQIEAGKRGLSLGYRVADLKRQDGEYNGQKFTHRQTGTTVNHLAVCVAGRVGNAARINLDGASVQIETTSQENRMPDDVKLVTVNLDSLTYQAAPEVAQALTKETARADAAEVDAQKVRTDMQAEIDKVQAKLDEAEEQLKQRSDDAIADQVKQRVTLLAEAGTIVKDAADLVGKSDREIREAVIATKYDGLDLSGKSDDYVTARYDGIIEAARDEPAKRQVQRTTPRNDADGGTRTDSKAAFDAMRDQWKRKDKK
ncbi:MAG: hypothetical protein Unbinned3138contig1000_48 [Prokaryotic dsDNA virus sp.]|nr:MAG: hypothetical protein Unbinned3138contig1000_48 [Prokaryotic dsDNA virus sp.]